MRTSVIIKSTILIISLIFISLAATDILYSEMNDKTDRLSQNQSNVFSPGYINAAKQKTESIIGQLDPKKSFMDRIVENVQNRLSNKVAEDSTDRTQPELKKKTGGTGEETNAQDSRTDSAAASDQYDIAIGSGSDSSKVYEGNRLISEVIDGKRYVYAGFDNVGKSTIQDAINVALAGDTVIVKAGTYINTRRYLTVKDGVNLYGGYSESGIRDIRNTPTVYAGIILAGGISRPTEINGFTISNLQILRSSNVTISNNTFSNFTGGAPNLIVLEHPAVRIEGSSAVLKNNTFNGLNSVGIIVTNLYRTSEIISTNNNYNIKNLAIGLLGATNLSSTNDYFAGQAVGGNGASGPNVSVTNPATSPLAQTTTSLTKSTTSTLDSRITTTYQSRLDEYSRSLDTLLTTRSGKELDANTIASIFKGLIKGKEGILASNMGLQGNPQVEAIVLNALKESALSVPIANIKESNREEMEIALRLAEILKNPTESQKMTLNSIESLLSDINKIEDGKSASPELQKASDELIQMVATVLLAQAIPDLFKEGDVTNIKAIFTELNTTKNRIMLEYQDATKPYYSEIVKEMSKNMAILQLKNMLSNKMTKEQLEKLPPNELDKILEKLRQAKDKSLEEEYILQQEAKYRSLYIEPNKKMLEDNMKHMLEGFTKRISGVLEGVKTDKK